MKRDVIPPVELCLMESEAQGLGISKKGNVLPGRVHHTHIRVSAINSANPHMYITDAHVYHLVSVA